MLLVDVFVEWYLGYVIIKGVILDEIRRALILLTIAVLIFFLRGWPAILTHQDHDDYKDQHEDIVETQDTEDHVRCMGEEGLRCL